MLDQPKGQDRAGVGDAVGRGQCQEILALELRDGKTASLPWASPLCACAAADMRGRRRTQHTAWRRKTAREKKQALSFYCAGCKWSPHPFIGGLQVEPAPGKDGAQAWPATTTRASAAS